MFLYCVLIFVVIYGILLLFKFTKNSANTEKWELIGEVKKIYIYPVDGGPGINLKRALCTKSGFRVQGLVDRGIIAYSASNNSAIFNLGTFEYNLENRKKFFSKLKNDSVLRFIKDINYLAEKSSEIEIDYLGDPIKVVPFPTSAPLATVFGNLPNDVQLCYFAANERSIFMKIIRDKLKIIQDVMANGFSCHYSNFTIIDTGTLKEPQDPIIKQHLTKLSFHPHLVIEGKIPHDATVLRIGTNTSNTQFTNITPCNIVLPNFQDISFLFGFNVDLKNQTLNSQEITAKQGTIVQVGDEVYMKK